MTAPFDSWPSVIGVGASNGSDSIAFAISGDEAEPFRAAARTEIADVVNNTVFDYHEGGVAAEHRLVVHAPEHRWSVTTLGASARVEPDGESVRVTLRSASPRVIARQLVGLGGAVRVETSALREEMRTAVAP